MPTDLTRTDEFVELADEVNVDRKSAQPQTWRTRANVNDPVTETASQRLLASIRTSLSEQYRDNATARGIKIDSLEIWTTGKTDGLTPTALSNQNSQSHAAEWRVYLKSDALSEAIQELHEYTIRTSPFNKILTNRVELTVEVISPDAWHKSAWCDPS